MIEVFGVPQDEKTIRFLWDQGFEQGIQMALDQSPDAEVAQDVLGDLLEGLVAGWVVMSDQGIIGILTTFISEKNGVTKAVIQHCAGTNMHLWLDKLYLVEDWAREHGAEKIEIHGRAGWARVLDKYDYSPQYVTLGKTL